MKIIRNQKVELRASAWSGTDGVKAYGIRLGELNYQHALGDLGHTLHWQSQVPCFIGYSWRDRRHIGTRGIS